MAYLDQDEDTICALATPAGVSGIAVVRLSGERSLEFAKECCEFLCREIVSHRAFVGTFRGKRRERVIDEVIVTFFEKGKSYTGEEVVEISCHGNPVIVSEILEEVMSFGARLALPGEFTFRAFRNGRMDLVQAESVLSLIEARCQKVKDVAVEQLKGKLSEQIRRIRTRLINIAARLEVNLDLLSDESIGTSLHILQEELKCIEREFYELLGSFRSGKILNDGFRVVLVGEPNVGKSSLLNALVGEERSIVTEVPGTTRDVVEKEIMCDGVRIIFCDTAGLRETNDHVEKLGIDRSYEEIQRADLVLYVADVASKRVSVEFDEVDEFVKANVWCVGNKADLLEDERFIVANEGIKYFVSAKRGSGIDQLLRGIREQASPREAEESLIVINARQASILNKCLEQTKLVIEMCETEMGEEILAFEVGQIIRLLCELLGEEFGDQVINEIFGQFCVGK